MSTDLKKLRELCEKATPGPWELWDSCSWRRFGSAATGRTIVEPQTYSSTDRHPDLHFNNPHDKPYIAAADPQTVLGLLARVEELERERDALAKFKAFVHRRLDSAGIPTHPDGPHSKEGCRIGDRLDIALAAQQANAELTRQVDATAQLYRDLREQDWEIQLSAGQVRLSHKPAYDAETEAAIEAAKASGE